MKKSLLALAVLGAFAGAASAQSSVTVYGVIDQGVSKLNNGASSIGLPAALAGNANQWSLKSNTSSRLGFRGTEDLGNGLKANFMFEHRFQPDNGGQEAAAFWHGASWVGLSHAMGEVRLGRDYVPSFYVSLAGDPWGYDYNLAGFVANTRAATGTARAANQVSVKSQSFGGLTAMVAVAAGEGVTGRNTGGNLIYTAGPLFAGVGVNDVDGPATNRLTVGTVAYDLGFVRPSFVLSQQKTGAVKTDAWALGATAPLAGGVVKVGYGEIDLGGVARAGKETKKFGLGYQYNLSKRTSVHADVGSAKGNLQTRTTGFEAGVKHVF